MITDRPYTISTINKVFKKYYGLSHEEVQKLFIGVEKQERSEVTGSAKELCRLGRYLLLNFSDETTPDSSESVVDKTINLLERLRDYENSKTKIMAITRIFPNWIKRASNAG